MGMHYEGERVTTTFWQDFTIADLFGVDAIKDTYNRAFNEWKSDYKYLTELVMVLNHKIWEHYEKNNPVYTELYDELWRTTHEWAYDNLKGAELRFYIDVLD